MIEEQASKDDVLVPIRLEIDVDGLVLRDTFTWNLHGNGTLRRRDERYNCWHRNLMSMKG